MSEQLQPYFPFITNYQLNSIVRYIDGIYGLNLASVIILASAISVGVIVTLNAIRIEFGKNLRTMYLLLTVLLEICLFVMFAPNKNDAVLGFTVLYVAHTTICLIYGLGRSRSIYKSMQQSKSASGNHNLLFWVAVFFILAGEALTFVFLSSSKSTNYSTEIIGGVSQISIFIGLCCWIHFLNLLERTGASPKIIRRMFWGALGVILLAVITLLLLIIIFFVIFNESKVNIVESVNGILVDRTSSNTIYYSLIASMIILVLLIFGNHLCYVTILGYTIWDICTPRKSEWDEGFERKSARNLPLTAI
jgi:hypothetical protein